MSIYISIGNKCNIKHQIDKHKGLKETLFFDWLETDMNSVISILACNDIQEILYFENIFRDPMIPNIAEKTKSRVELKSLTKCVFVHDLPINMKDQDVYEFIEKYKRRFKRMIDYINGKEKIIFLRYGSITDVEKNKFIEVIQKINPQCNFVLVSIKIEQNENQIKKEDFFLEINLTTKYQPNDWKSNFLDWKQIFADIEQHG